MSLVIFPKVSPCESIGIICSTLCRDLLFFVRDAGLAALFCQYSPTKVLLEYGCVEWDGNS